MSLLAPQRLLNFTPFISMFKYWVNGLRSKAIVLAIKLTNMLGRLLPNHALLASKAVALIRARNYASDQEQ